MRESERHGKDTGADDCIAVLLVGSASLFGRTLGGTLGGSEGGRGSYALVLTRLMTLDAHDALPATPISLPRRAER